MSYNPKESAQNKQTYSVKEYVIDVTKEQSEISYNIRIFDFPAGLASAKGDPRIQQLFDDVVEFSHRDDIFPKTRPGESLEQPLLHSLNDTSIMVTCTLPGEDKIAGYSAFTRKNFGDLSVLHVGLAAVATEHNGASLAYRMREPILREENADIIDGVTVNPRIYSTYQKVAETFGYEFQPQSINPPEEVVNFTRRMLQQAFSPEAAHQLDKMMVRRNYLPDTPTGKEVWKGDPLFEAMGIAKEHGVQLMLVKPGIIPH